MKTVLTTEQIAKIAAGVPLTQLGLSAEALADVQEEQARQAKEAKLVSDKAAEDTAKAALQATADAAAAEAAKKAAGGTENADGLAKVTADLNTANIQVGLLQSQLVTAQASLVTVNAELVNIKASTQSMTANHDGMLAQLRTALGRLQIAMGGSDTSASMDGVAATAAYASLSESFTTKFKVGQASKTAPETKPGVVAADENLLRFQRAAAAAQAQRKTN